MIEEEKPKEEPGETEGVMSIILGKRGPHTSIKDARKPYNFTDKCLAARRKNALKSTGPKTAEGKAICAQNSWKTGVHATVASLGLIGKPCHSTCTKYPCSLVDDGATKPGADCLDKEFFVDSIQHFQQIMLHKKIDGAKEIFGLTLAMQLNILHDMQSRVMADGSVVKNPMLDKEGRLVGWVHALHPALLGLPKMMAQLGISFDSMLMTPASILKAEQGKTDDDKEDAMYSMAKVISLMAEQKLLPAKLAPAQAGGGKSE